MRRAGIATAILRASALPAPRICRDHRADGSSPSRGARARARARSRTAHRCDARNDAPRKAIAYGQEALSILKSSSDSEVEVTTCNELGWAYMMVSDYAKAADLIERGRALAEKTGNQKGLACAINNLGGPISAVSRETIGPERVV